MSFTSGGIVGQVSGGIFTLGSVLTADLCLRRAEPASGPVSGGTEVTIYVKEGGENIITVLINGAIAEITEQHDTYIKIITPMGAPGLADIYAATLTLSDTLENEFDYYQLIDGDGPFVADVIKTVENYHYIEWEFTPPDGASIDDYNFKIYWSESPECPFNVIQDSEGEDIVIDGAVGPLVYTHELKQYNFNEVQYYKVLSILKSTPTITSYSEVAYIGMHFDGLHAVMCKAESLLNNMYCGEPALVVKKKSTGTRCPECWSEDRQQRTQTHCDTCGGSGFVDGYYCAIEAQITFDSEDLKSSSERNFEDVFDSKRARMSNYPMVRPKDLVVNRDEYKRYVVTHVETTKLPLRSKTAVKLSKQNYVVSQLLTLQELNPDDNAYDLDITELLSS